MVAKDQWGRSYNIRQPAKSESKLSIHESPRQIVSPLNTIDSSIVVIKFGNKSTIRPPHVVLIVFTQKQSFKIII